MNLEITIDDITPELLQEFINKDKGNPNKIFMLEAENYYNVKNTKITGRRKMMMLLDDNDKSYIKDDLSKANNKAKHSYLQELVNQCTNYLVGKPLKIDYKKAFGKATRDTNHDGVIDEKDESVTGDTKTKQDIELISNELYKNNSFEEFLQKNVTNVQIYGKSYMRIVVSEGKIKFVTYNPKEIIMFYDDFDEPSLTIRYFTKPELGSYMDDVYKTKSKGLNRVENKKQIKEVQYAEVFDHQYKDLWKQNKGKWEKQGKRELLYANKVKFGKKEMETPKPIDVAYPIIEWKFNPDEIPTLANIKDFIDLQDINLSDLANNVEDIQEAIWVLENYNGQNIKEFMDDLKIKKAIKVGVGGAAKPETIQIPTEARDRLYEICRKNIYKFGFGIDFQERDSLGNVSGVALKWSYAPLEQKANTIETHGKKALNKFFNILFKLMGMDYDSNDLEFMFDRTMIANEQEQTAMIMSASDEISKKTILDNLPMVLDTEDELERLKTDEETEPIVSDETFESRNNKKEEPKEEDKKDNGNIPGVKLVRK